MGKHPRCSLACSQHPRPVFQVLSPWWVCCQRHRKEPPRPGVGHCCCSAAGVREGSSAPNRKEAILWPSALFIARRLGNTCLLNQPLLGMRPGGKTAPPHLTPQRTRAESPSSPTTTSRTSFGTLHGAKVGPWLEEHPPSPSRDEGRRREAGTAATLSQAQLAGKEAAPSPSQDT